MERALGELALEAGKVHEEDPKAMAKLMRRFSERTGLRLNENMEKALSRLEAGESPDLVEKDMGDVFGSEEEQPFDFSQSRKGSRQKPPGHDENLYELE